MTLLSWGILLATLAGMGFAALQIVLYKMGPYETQTILVDGKSLAIKIRYGSPMAQRLNTYGIALFGRMWLYFEKAQQRRGRVAHEVLHLVYEHLNGKVLTFLDAVFQRVTQRVHNRRSLEEDVRRGQEVLAQRGEVSVFLHGKWHVVEAPFLRDLPE